MKYVTNQPIVKPRSFLQRMVALLLACATPAAMALTVPVTQNASVPKAGNLAPRATLSPTLTVSNRNVALLEFDFSNPSAIPRSLTPVNVKNATLWLYVANVRVPGQLDVYAVTSPMASLANKPVLPAIAPQVLGSV